MSDWTESLLRALRAADLTSDPADVADVMWLAGWMVAALPNPEAAVEQPMPERLPVPPIPPLPPEEDRPPTNGPDVPPIRPEPAPPTPEPMPIHLARRQSPTTAAGGRTFLSPSARALPDSLALLRTLRPLMRRVASRDRLVVDEAETVRRVAEEGIWMPAVKPARERWLRLALVVDAGSSMGVWTQAAAEFAKVLQGSGAFLHISAWTLDVEQREPRLCPGLRPNPDGVRGRDLRELIDPSGRSAVLVLSDCVGAGWYDGRAAAVIEAWGRKMPVALVQMLPEQLWSRTALGYAEPVVLSPRGAAVPNTQLACRSAQGTFDLTAPEGMPLPVLSLEPAALSAWSRLVRGSADAQMPGVALNIAALPAPAASAIEVSATERVQRFRETASPLARKLGGLLAAAPVISLPVLRLIRESLLPQARQVHEAEVLLADLLRVEDEAANPDEVRYDFHPGVRDLLLDAVPTPSTLAVLERVSRYVEAHLGMGSSFRAMLRDPASAQGTLVPGESPFAQVAADVLRRLGGDYARLVQSPQLHPIAGPTVWVRVVGTGTRDLSADQREASQIVGWILAEEGYGLITCGWPGVEDEAEGSFIATLTERGTYPVERAWRQILADNWFQANATLPARSDEQAANQWQTSISLADAVILIGGRGSPAATSAAYALRAGKPLLPLAVAGGIASVVHQDMLRDWDSQPVQPLSRDDFLQLARPLGDGAELRRILRTLLKGLQETPSTERPSPNKEMSAKSEGVRTAVEMELTETPATKVTPAADLPRPGRGPSAWVSVAGTVAHELPDDQLLAARTVGRVLAEEGYGLVTGGYPGVDYVVATTFADALEMPGIPADFALRQVLVQGQRLEHDHGQVIRVASEEEQHVTGLRQADVMILIGGDGVRDTAGRARQAGKPVLPLAATGGDARAVFEEIFLDWGQRPMPPLRVEDFWTLERPLTPDGANLRRLLQALLTRETSSHQAGGQGGHIPRVVITHDSKVGGVPRTSELPFVVGVMADLTGGTNLPRSTISLRRQPELAERRFQAVDRANFTRLLAESQPALALTVPNRLAGENASPLIVELLFECLEDFHPARLAERVSVLQDLRKRWETAAANRWLTPSFRDRTQMGPLIQEAERRLEETQAAFAAQLRDILHHPDFQRLEATWRGLRFLVQHTTMVSNLKLRILNVSKGELVQDLAQSVELERSALFGKIYGDRLARSDGEPCGLLIGDYEFDHSPEDLSLLTKIATVAARAHAPFVAAASPRMLNLMSFTELAGLLDLASVFDETCLPAWKAFRDSEDSHYVALTVPRILARPLYGQESLKIDAFAFEEMGDDKDHNHYLWMSAAWAYAARVTEAFARDGWFARTCGPEGGKVEGLPVGTFPADGGPPVKCPTEIAISGRREFELTCLGFLPLTATNDGSAAFLSASSCRNPRDYFESGPGYDRELGAELNYTLCASRFVHYLLVIARDILASSTPAAECENRLNRWLADYVLTNPPRWEEDLPTSARCPLLEGKIELRERYGRYKIIALLRPHFQFEPPAEMVRVVAPVPSLRPRR